MKEEQNSKTSIDSIAYVEMYVGNIFQSKNFFCNALKFKHIATRKDETKLSLLMKQGDMYLILTSNLNGDTEIAKHINYYGDSVKKISLWVSDVDACFASAVAHGAKTIFSPQQKEGVNTAAVDIYNNVEHEFLDLTASEKIPGFDYTIQPEANPMIFNFDHIASCHPVNHIHKLVSFYKNAFGFSENKNEDIYSEESGMHIIIMKSPNGKVKFPLVEPSSDKSPLHTYLKFNHGSGVHHIAFETNDIVDAVKYYEDHHGELRKAPPSYYEEVSKSYPEQLQNIKNISPYGIMLEQDDKGVLFQIFTKPVVTRPTLFLEFVQREICEGFGTVNIKTLYESLEA